MRPSDGLSLERRKSPLNVDYSCNERSVYWTCYERSKCALRHVFLPIPWGALVSGSFLSKRTKEKTAWSALFDLIWTFGEKPEAELQVLRAHLFRDIDRMMTSTNCLMTNVSGGHETPTHNLWIWSLSP